MKFKIITLFILINSLIIIGLTFSQTSVSNFKYQIRGTVIDDKSKNPLSFASVQIKNALNDKLINGGETDENGNFFIEIYNTGSYKLKISFIGYYDFTTDFTIDDVYPRKDMGIINLKPAGLITDEIIIESERSVVEFQANKKVFNVEKTMSTQGGTALDVIKNIPSVDVDVDGNISFRGNQNVKITIDGKTSGLTPENRNRILEQIPADQIVSVEVISNPSAKYDAEGTTGIINLVLKKNQISGYNGGFSLNAGTKDKYAGSFNLNLKNDRINFSSSYDYRLNNFITNADNFIEYFNDNTSLNQINTGTYKNKGHLFKLNFDYTFDNKTSFVSALNFNDRNISRKENSTIDVSGTAPFQTLSNTMDLSDGFSIDGSVNFTRKLSNPKDVLTFDASYSKNRDISNTDQNEYYSNGLNPYLEKFANDDNNDEINIQSDLIKNFGTDYKIETGVKSSFKISNKDYNVNYYDYILQGFVNNNGLSNFFKYNEQIYSAYITHTGKLGFLNYNIGIRAENTVTKGELVNTGEIYERNYFDLFPNAVISTKIGSSREIQLSYSRRINRPSTSAQNPFRSVLDPINSFKGNPELKPEYINSLELGFIQYTPFGVFTPTVFYRNSDNFIARSRSLIDSIRTVTTFNNYGTVQSYGLELVFNATPLKFWNLNGSFSYFKRTVDAQNLQEGFKNENYTWSSRISSNMRLPDLFDMQLSYFFSGKNVVAQGTIEPFQSFDATIKRDFFDNRFSLALRFADIFNTMKFRINLDDPNFYTVFSRKRDTQSVFLILTYKFGKEDKSAERKKKRDNSPQQNDGYGF